MKDVSAQIEELDEGALLALSQGVTPDPPGSLDAKQIQTAMKIIDDNFFCSLEPTGIILTYGISDRPLPVVYQDLNGQSVVIKQPLIVVGNKFHGGVHAWGAQLDADLQELETFLFP